MPDRPPLPPFDRPSALTKVQAAEDAWNTRDPERVAGAYTADSAWRNRDAFFTGRAAIIEFLTAKWVPRTRLRATQEPVGLRREQDRGPAPVRMPRRRGPVAQLRQRAVGVRRARPDAPPRPASTTSRSRTPAAHLRPPAPKANAAPSSRSTEPQLISGWPARLSDGPAALSPPSPCPFAGLRRVVLARVACLVRSLIFFDSYMTE